MKTPNSLWTRVRSCAVVLGALCLFGGAASAEKQYQALVFPFDGALAGDRDDRSAITDAARALVADGGAEATLGQSSVADTALLVGCDPKEADCLAAIALTMSVDIVVTGSLMNDGKQASISLTIARSQQFPETIEIPVNGKSTAEVVAEFRRAAAVLLSGRPLAEAPADPAEITPTDAGDTADATNAGGVGVDASRGSGAVERSTRPAKWPTIVAAGGLVLVGAGTAFWLAGNAQQDDIDAHPNGTLDELRALEDLEDSAQSKVTIGRALFGAGVVTAAVGTVFFLKQRKQRKSAMAIAPVLVPAGGGLALTGSW